MPRGAVAERWVLVDAFLAADEVGFLAVDFAEEDGFGVDAPLLGCFGLWVVEVGVSEEAEDCGGSDRFPSTGETASKAHSAAASTRAGTCVERGGKTGLIDSM